MLKTVIIVLIMFELLVVCHELGHFMTAKKAGIKVNEFSIGMGPAIFKKQFGETLYSFRILPLGGYNAIEGEDGNADDDRSFASKSVPVRFIVLAAGSIMNYLFALVILFIMLMMIGMPTNTLGSVEAGSPAENAGLVAGDTVISINGESIDSWEDLSNSIQDSKVGDILTTEVIREGSDTPLTYEVSVSESDTGSPRIGILAGREKNVIFSVKNSLIGSVNLIIVMYKSLYMIFTGQTSVNEVVGPVGLVSVMGSAASESLLYILYITALVSVNLAVINLLPFPALDGGRLLVLIIEAVRRKKLDPEVEGRIHYLGFVLLMVLAVFITIKDINQFIIK